MKTLITIFFATLVIAYANYQFPDLDKCTPWEYYCYVYLEITPDKATSEQENYYLDVFLETDEGVDLYNKLQHNIKY